MEQMHLLFRVVAPVTCKMEPPILSCPIGEMTYRPGDIHARGTFYCGPSSVLGMFSCSCCSATSHWSTSEGAVRCVPSASDHFERPSGDVLEWMRRRWPRR